MLVVIHLLDSEDDNIIVPVTVHSDGGNVTPVKPRQPEMVPEPALQIVPITPSSSHTS